MNTFGTFGSGELIGWDTEREAEVLSISGGLSLSSSLLLLLLLLLEVEGDNGLMERVLPLIIFPNENGVTTLS